MLKILVKMLTSQYLMNMLMDQFDTLHVGRYRSEALCCTIATQLGGFEVKDADLKNMFKFLELYITLACGWTRLSLPAVIY